MPFIWDDFEWKLVDDEEPYDKQRFVVVRKLRVKPNKHTPIQEFSVDQIRQHVRKFGVIESIEILTTDEQEAHVTFTSDRSAYLMLLQHEYDKRTYRTQPFEIEPADSWEQPVENDMEIDEQESEINKLNEDCLLHLFKFLDLNSLVNMADMCKQFNRLLHQYFFPHIRKFKVTDDFDPAYSLAKVRRALLCIGSHISELSYDVPYDETKCPGRTSKFVRVIAENVGQNIRRAYFGFILDKDNRMLTLAPILRNLESLEIYDNDEHSSYDIDFQASCPNLVEFQVHMDMPLVACCKPWPSLRSLSVRYNQKIQTQILISFIEKNPQLNSLQFDSLQSSKILSKLTKKRYLAGVEKLTIVNKMDAKDFAKYFTRLSKLPLLSEIILEKLDKNHLKMIVKHLPSFKNLRKISLFCKLIFYKDTEIGDYGQSLVDLAEKLPLLEELKLQRIPINEDILMNFVCCARQLKTLFIRDCEIIFTDELVNKLVDTLKSDERNLQLYLDKENVDKLEKVKIKEIECHLQLKWI